MEKFSKEGDSRIVEQAEGSNNATSQSGSPSWRVVRKMESPNAGSSNTTVQQPEESANQASQTGTTHSGATGEIENPGEPYISNAIQDTEGPRSEISPSGSTPSRPRVPGRGRRLQDPLSILRGSTMYSLFRNDWEELQRALVPMDQSPEALDELYDSIADDWEQLEREIRAARPWIWTRRDGA